MSKRKVTIEIEDLNVTFSRWGQTVKAIEGINLTIPAGQWLFVVGHNGSGKSTMLRAISGSLIPNGGKIRVDGDVLSSLSSSRISERVFHVHQDPLLGTAPTLTLFEKLFVDESAAQRRANSRAEQHEKYYHVLQSLGLEERL